VTEPTLEEFAAEDDILRGLRESNARLSRELIKAKASKAELVEAVFRAARDAVSGMTIGAVKAPSADKRKRGVETAVAMLSDWQLAKTTPDYDSDVCARRVDAYGDKVIELTDIQRADHPIRDLRVYLLGDLVEGELIFPGQSHRVDASLYRQVTMAGPSILGAFLRKMATSFDTIHVVGVIGNHGALGGRSRRDYHPESNADAMMYEITRLVTANEPRITWAPNFTPGERHWYAVDTIGKKSFLLFHGDQVKGGFAGFPWYGFAKKVMGWRMGAIPEPFDYAVAGHFHTPTRMLVGDVILWVSGSTESTNTYAAEMLAAQGTPSQWLLFVHPERGVTAEYCVYLEDAA